MEVVEEIKKDLSELKQSVENIQRRPITDYSDDIRNIFNRITSIEKMIQESNLKPTAKAELKDELNEITDETNDLFDDLYI